MADKKKVELNEENLEEVAGGGITTKDAIAITAAVVAGSTAAYQGYYQTKKFLDSADGTSKAGDGKSANGTTVNNSVSGTRNKSGLQGQNINLGSNSKFNL